MIEAMKRWRDALNQALEWDGYDSEGVPSVWHDVANKAIAEMDAAIKAAGKPFGYLCEWRSKVLGGTNNQAFYYGEPGSATADDWNESPDIYKNLPLYTHPAKRLTDEEILANDTLRYYFGLNGGAGPVSEKGRKIVDAVMDAMGVKE